MTQDSHPLASEPATSQITHNYPLLENRDSESPTQSQSGKGVEADSDALDDRKRVAIELMLNGATQSDIARTVGVSRKALYLWRTEDEAFRDELARRRRELLDSGVDRFRSLLATSLSLLEQQLRDPYAMTSLRAARTLLVMSGIHKVAMAAPAEVAETSARTQTEVSMDAPAAPPGRAG